MMRLVPTICVDQRGNSLIEMALVAREVLVGTIDLSRAYSTKLQLEQAAQRTIELVQRSDYQTSNNSTFQADAEAAAGTGSTAAVTSWLECNNDGVHLNYDSGT